MFETLGSGISTLSCVDWGGSILTAAAGQAAFLEETDINRWIVIILVWILGIAVILFPEIYSRALRLFYSMVAALRTAFESVEGKKWTDDDTLDKAINTAGYTYDPKQDIFYSKMDAWQRDMGYCRLYDEAAAPLNMIIDCEPIYFYYGGKRWMIEFWKGQYAMTTGCEVGVYTTEEPDINIPGVFNGPFFNCASDEDLLKIRYSLEKSGETIFTREGRHWWLTGFKLGEFAEPWELTMFLSVTLKDAAMRSAFVKGLKEAGYKSREIIISGNTVGLKFDKTRTPQPITRIPETDWIIQRKNQLLCNIYQDITALYDNFPDKIKAIREQAPEIYERILDIGKNKELFEKFISIKDFLNQ